jgi:hypothetical protein
MAGKKKQAKKRAAKGGKGSAGKAKDAKSASPAKSKAKEKPKVDLTPLKKKAQEAKAAFDRATKEAEALRKKAKGIEAAAKKAYVEALAPYRDACRRAGAKYEFTGTRAANVAPAVRFTVEKVKTGVRVMIKGKPKTEKVIPFEELKKSVGKAAFAYTDKFIGPRETIGAKGAGLGNRLRAALAKS